jgi:hypothetical protein
MALLVAVLGMLAGVDRREEEVEVREVSLRAVLFCIKEVDSIPLRLPRTKNRKVLKHL